MRGWLIAAGLAVLSAPLYAETPAATFHREPPDPKVQKCIDEVAVKATKRLLKPKCAAFFAALPDGLPPDIGVVAGHNSEPTTVAWSECKAYPRTVFLSIDYLSQLTNRMLAQLVIHEAAHLAQCSTRGKTMPSEREAVSVQAERACFGNPLRLRVVFP